MLFRSLDGTNGLDGADGAGSAVVGLLYCSDLLSSDSNNSFYGITWNYELSVMENGVYHVKAHINTGWVQIGNSAIYSPSSSGHSTAPIDIVFDTYVGSLNRYPGSWMLSLSNFSAVEVTYTDTDFKYNSNYNLTGHSGVVTWAPSQSDCTYFDYSN